MGIEIPRKETRAFHDENNDFPDAVRTRKTRKPAFVTPGVLAGVSATVLLVGVGFLAIRALSGMEFSGDEEAEGQRFTDEFRRQYDLENQRRRANGEELLPLLPPEPRPFDPNDTTMSGDTDGTESENPEPKKEKISDELYKVMDKLRSARSVEQCMAILREHPEIKIDAFIVNEVILKAQSLGGAMEVFKYFGVQPDTHILTSIMRKTTSTHEALGLLQWFTAEYPGLKPNGITATAIMSNARTASEAFDVQNRLLQMHPDIQVNAGMKAVVYAKAQSISELKWYFENLEQQYPHVRNNKVSLATLYNMTAQLRADPGASAFLRQLDSFVESQPDLVRAVDRSPNLMLQRSLAFFVFGREAEGIEALKQAIMQGSKLNHRDIQTLSNLAFTFLPPNHSLREVLALTLQNNGMGDVIERAQNMSARYADVRERTTDGIVESMRERYAGGSVFDGRHDRPIDKNARSVAPPPRGVK